MVDVVKNKDAEPATIGELFRDYHYCQNPVTKSVLMKCICDRLDEMEKLNAKRITIN